MLIADWSTLHSKLCPRRESGSFGMRREAIAPSVANEICTTPDGIDRRDKNDYWRRPIELEGPRTLPVKEITHAANQPAADTGPVKDSLPEAKVRSLLTPRKRQPADDEHARRSPGWRRIDNSAASRKTTAHCVRSRLQTLRPKPSLISPTRRRMMSISHHMK